MNASKLTCVAVLGLLSLAACDKKADGAGTAGSASATGAMAPAMGKKDKVTRKLADLKSAYKGAVDNMSTDPMEKKVEAMVTKVGKPDADSGRKKTWYALDGEKCVKVEVDSKDGSMMDQSTDKADCGM